MDIVLDGNETYKIKTRKGMMIMKIHLIDTINQRDETYKMPDPITYRELWKEIEKIIDDKNYSYSGFTIPIINEKEHIITVRWIELFGDLLTPYIEIEEYSETILKAFELQIQRYNKRKGNKIKQ